MKRLFYYILTGILGAVVLVSCERNELQHNNATGQPVQISLSVASKAPIEVKSRATETDENAIDRVIFFIFDEEGKLAIDPIVADDTKTTPFYLKAGIPYQGYAIANADALPFQDISVANESTIEDLTAITYRVTLDQWDADGAEFVMTGSAEIRVNVNQTVYPIPVYRMCAKIDMTVSYDAKVADKLPGFEIIKIGLSNIASEAPYCFEGEYGAYTGTPPAVRFDTGKPAVVEKTPVTVSFYMLENLSGGRVDEEDVSEELKNKFPGQYIGEQQGKRKYAPATASHVVIEAQYLNGNYYNTVKYWVYLGHNNHSDYNVKRNEHHKYVVTIKGKEESDLDTRVEVDETKSFNESDVANCYIVSEGGDYKFPTYCMGSRKNQLLNTEGHQVKAIWLWTDIMDGTPEDSDFLITNIDYYDDNGYGMMSFTINGDPTNNIEDRGNMIVALYDEETNEIIWSWHLWITDEPRSVVTGGQCNGRAIPDANYSADAALGKMYIMDRNLGATAASPDDLKNYSGHEDEIWRTYGLYYQMGRKDPFAGAKINGTTAEMLTGGYYESMPFERAKEGSEATTQWNPAYGWIFRTDNWTTARLSATMPMEFIAKSGDNRWTETAYNNSIGYFGSSEPKYLRFLANGNGDPYYRNPFFSTGAHEDFWNRTKTVHDPCPAGWTVLGRNNEDKIDFPDVGTSVTAQFLNKDKNTWQPLGSGYGGMYSQLTGYDPVWWPAAGVRSLTGKLQYLGTNGMYFHSDHISANHGGHMMDFTSGKLVNSHDSQTNDATPIRCVRKNQKF